jgi:hypothetical protein
MIIISNNVFTTFNIQFKRCQLNHLKRIYISMGAKFVILITRTTCYMWNAFTYVVTLIMDKYMEKATRALCDMGVSLFVTFFNYQKKKLRL